MELDSGLLSCVDYSRSKITVYQETNVTAIIIITAVILAKSWLCG